MHPSELKNRALLTAVVAELDGFTATAKAFRQLALMFSEDAIQFRLAMNPAAIQHGANTTLKKFEVAQVSD